MQAAQATQATGMKRFTCNHRGRYLAILAISAAMIAGSAVSAAGFSGEAAGSDSSTLQLDQDGADVVPTVVAWPAGRMDTATLYLDRDGADIPAGNWWASSNYAGGPDNATNETYQGPDISMLNLDRDGADVVNE